MLVNKYVTNIRNCLQKGIHVMRYSVKAVLLVRAIMLRVLQVVVTKFVTTTCSTS